MKTKGLVLVSCLAAAAVIASPALGEIQKKSRVASGAKTQRTAPKTAQVMPTSRHGNMSSNIAPRHYAGNQRYTSTRQYAGNRQFVRARESTGTQYYGRSGYATNRYYGNGYYGSSGYYYGGPSYYYGGSWGYPYSGGGYASNGYYPYSYYGGYPYSYYGGYSNTSSYYQPRYGYQTTTVAAVQHRLGELGYYQGVVDGIMGPQTRAAIAAFESTHGMIVDGMITTRLLNRVGV
ncbi:MAG: peptidoglycan-binding domain-containing protein [Candidatus Udaeobacter sp.]